MKEIYTLMECKPGRLYKRTYVELHHSDSEEKNKNEMLDAYMIFIDRKKNKKSKMIYQFLVYDVDGIITGKVGSFSIQFYSDFLSGSKELVFFRFFEM